MKLALLLTGLAAATASGTAHAIAWYFQSPASKMAQDIDTLHQVVMWIIVVIFVGVFGFMFYACFAHRKSIGHKAEQFHENTTVEILWTVIPAVVLAIIAVPTVQTIFKTQGQARGDALQIEVIGHQWWWEFRYPQYGVTTANEVY
ncbi:MAG: cytochrome c oxidase subunit II transmembrane domain-containing protein, partial [Burkholderiales bacterium]